MVLESMLSPESVQRSPYSLVFLSFVFVSIALVGVHVLGYPNGFLLIALVCIPLAPLVLSLFSFEERGIARSKESSVLIRHFPIVLALALMFFGLAFSFAFYYLFMPPSASGESVFAAQVNELAAISNIGGFATKFTQEQAFETIFLHNLGVMILVIVLSLLYGSGAVLVISWNASVVGVFLGNVGKQIVFHADPAINALHGVGYGFLGLLPHATFEILCYSTAALAGGILSSAVIRRIHENLDFFGVLYDVAKLLAFAIIFLAIGAFIESTAFA